MPQMNTDAEIFAAQATARQLVSDFNAPAQNTLFDGNARTDGRSWVAATGRGGNGPQQTV